MILNGRTAAEGEVLPNIWSLTRRAVRAQNEAKALSDCLEVYTDTTAAICADVAALHRSGKIGAEDAAEIIAKVLVTTRRCKTILRDAAR